LHRAVGGFPGPAPVIFRQSGDALRVLQEELDDFRTLTIDSSASSGSTLVLLEGAAISRLISLTPVKVDFGEVEVGSEIITLVSLGSESVGVGTLTLEGAQPEAFGISADGCTGAFLHTDEICTFSVTFDAPAEAGLYTAAARVPSSSTSTNAFCFTRLM